jgi:hypothetical protein
MVGADEGGIGRENNIWLAGQQEAGIAHAHAAQAVGLHVVFEGSAEVNSYLRVAKARRRHRAQFSSHQFISLSVVRHSQEVFRGQKLGRDLLRRDSHGVLSTVL